MGNPVGLRRLPHLPGVPHLHRNRPLAPSRHGKTFIIGAFLDFESLGTTSDVEIVCVAKTKMADVNSPAKGDTKRLSSDDTNLQTNENVSEETDYLVSDYLCGLKPLFLQRLSTIRWFTCMFFRSTCAVVDCIKNQQYIILFLGFSNHLLVACYCFYINSKKDFCVTLLLFLGNIPRNSLLREVSLCL